MANDVIERKLVKVLEALDTGQYKNGYRLVNAMLAKYPLASHAIAIKAVLLEKLERYEEALAVCLEAKARLFADSELNMDTLITINTVCLRLDRLDLAKECYEHACGKLTNLELLTSLLNFYVHDYSFVEQQKTALKMYKIVPEEHHLLWAICSIQLQVFGSEEPDELLNLAEFLLNKHNTDHGLKEPEAILMYISVLEQLAKYDDALEILTGELGELIVPEVDRLRLEGRLLARACDYDSAAQVFQTILEERPDDWECFLHYLSCMLEDGSIWCGGTTHAQTRTPKLVDRKLSHLSDEVFDQCMLTASNFVRSLKRPYTVKFIRCPHLALLEIQTRLILQHKLDGDMLIKILLNYFERFGQLACFTSDVEMFLPVLTNDEKVELVESLKLVSLPGDKEELILARKITVFKLQELLGFMLELSLGELENNAVIMTELYTQSLPLSRLLDMRENMHGEELLSMACNVLVQLFWRTQQLGYLLEAILIMEFGLTVREYISQYKILLVHLYSHLGAFQLAYKWYKSLKIKNILLETLSHHILPQMLTSPFWVDSSLLLAEYICFMQGHLREFADLTFPAYRFHNYSQAIELVQFKNRMEHSHKFLMARLEAPILQLKNVDDNIEVEHVLQMLDSDNQFPELTSEENYKSLTFNEDMRTRPWWSPTPDINYLLESFEESSFRPGLGDENLQWQQEQAKKQEAYQKMAIKRKALLPRLLHLSIQSVSFLKENVGASSSESNSEFFSLLEDYAGSLGFPFNDAVDMIVGISNGQKSFQEVSSSSIVDWISFAVFLNAWKLGLPDEDGSATDYWKMVDNLIKNFTDEKITPNQDPITFPGAHLTDLVRMVTEPLAWHSHTMHSCIRLLAPSKKKKKKNGPAEQWAAPLSQAILSSLESLCATVELITKQLQKNIDLPEEQYLDDILLLSNTDRSEGRPAAPGRVFSILRNLYSPLETTEVKYGLRISTALQSWDAFEVIRNLINSQKATLSESKKICEKKLKLLQELKNKLLGKKK